MHRTEAQLSVYCCTMQDHRTAPIELLLRASEANTVRVDAYEEGRRNLYSQTVLRLQKHLGKSTEGRTQNKPKTSPRDDADHGVSWEPTGAKHLEKPPGTHQVSVSLEESRDYHAPPSVELRYHLHPITGWLCVSDGSDRLVQSPSSLSPSLQQSRWSFLPRGFRRSSRDIWLAWNLQHRPRGAVHIGQVCESRDRQGDPLEHGRKRKSSGQHFCRTALEVCKI